MGVVAAAEQFAGHSQNLDQCLRSFIDQTPSLGRVLATNPRRELIYQAARAAGMRTMQEEGILLVARGITATNGRSSRRAKYASLTAVEPLDASMTGVPLPIQPLHSA